MSAVNNTGKCKERYTVPQEGFGELRQSPGRASKELRRIAGEVTGRLLGDCLISIRRSGIVTSHNLRCLREGKRAGGASLESFPANLAIDAFN